MSSARKFYCIPFRMSEPFLFRCYHHGDTLHNIARGISLDRAVSSKVIKALVYKANSDLPLTYDHRELVILFARFLRV